MHARSEDSGDFRGDRSPWSRLLALVLRPTAPPLAWGVVVAVTFLAAEFGLVHLLKRIAPENAFGAVFLLGVLVVSAGWGFGLAVATSLASVAIYVYFHHLEGTGSLVPAAFVFLSLTLLTNVLVGQARLRAAEAEQRRREADLSAELARTVLRAADLREALAVAGTRTAEVLGLPWAAFELDHVPPDSQRSEIVLYDDTVRTGTLLVPAELPKAARQRISRMVPALEALLAAARDRERINDEFSALARQQTALRRVATLVARGADPERVYDTAAEELARGLGVEHVTLLRFGTDDDAIVLAARDTTDRARFAVGERLSLDGDGIGARVSRTGGTARIDDYHGVAGALAARLRTMGLRSGVGAPIAVDGRLRGALIVGSASPQALPPETEERIGDFADLVATAISNAETRAELTASRARIVSAADQARRGFERDLHDGAQQRIVSLGLELRAMQASAEAAGQVEISGQLTQAVDGLAGLFHDLQELSRGMHPAILSKGGIGPAIKTLARRSQVPVALTLEVDVAQRLPESVEVAAYYIVAEALTNAAKHAAATEVEVSVTVDHTHLRVVISDDGVGGALSARGSGLIGLKDRVEALAGHLEIDSRPGHGTTLRVGIPVNPA